MRTKNKPGSEWSDPDDAPELTADMLSDAELFEGDRFIKRGPGRPSTGNAREVISFRLDRDLVAKLREAGPGWQSRVNDMLRAAVGLRAAATGASQTFVETAGSGSKGLGTVRREPKSGRSQAAARPGGRAGKATA